MSFAELLNRWAILSRVFPRATEWWPHFRLLAVMYDGLQRLFSATLLIHRQCYYCEKKWSSQCERTNSNTLEHGMYGGNTAGMFGYSHFTGGFAGGQAEYVRVPLGDVNLLKLPDSVPDERGTCCSIYREYKY